jgi:glucose uptake protein GlcU
MFIILGVVAVILVVVGVIIYRKRSRWDELG